MNDLAILMGGICIYWHGVFMAIAVALAVIISFIMCGIFKKDSCSDLLNCLLLAFPVGFVFSRLLYWSCNFEEYESISDHLNVTRGGYTLYGVIIGILVTVSVIKLFSRSFNAGAVCDCMAVGGSFSIIIGRLSAYFSGDNVGMVLKGEKYHIFPLTIYNAHRGEWLLAVFNFEAFFALIISVALVIFFALNSNEKKGMKGRHGDIALLFLLLHGCSQGLFDSMHVDALYVMGNSFVRLQQILGAVFFTAVTVIFTIRSVKVNGFKWYHPVSPLVSLAAVGITLAMELNRISYHNFIRNYSVIFLCMLCAAINGILIYLSTLPKKAEAV